MATGVLELIITHNYLSISAPLRLSTDITIGKLKEKLYITTGTDPSHQKLLLQDAAGNTQANLDNDDMTLGFYDPDEGYIIHVIDTNPASMAKDVRSFCHQNPFESVNPICIFVRVGWKMCLK